CRAWAPAVSLLAEMPICCNQDVPARAFAALATASSASLAARFTPSRDLAAKSTSEGSANAALTARRGREAPPTAFATASSASLAARFTASSDWAARLASGGGAAEVLTASAGASALASGGLSGMIEPSIWNLEVLVIAAKSGYTGINVSVNTN